MIRNPVGTVITLGRKVSNKKHLEIRHKETLRANPALPQMHYGLIRSRINLVFYRFTPVTGAVDMTRNKKPYSDRDYANAVRIYYREHHAANT